MSGVGVQDVKFSKKSIKSYVKNSCSGIWLGQKGNKIPIYRGKNHQREMNTMSLEMEGCGGGELEEQLRPKGRCNGKLCPFWTGAHSFTPRTFI